MIKLRYIWQLIRIFYEVLVAYFQIIFHFCEIISDCFSIDVGGLLIKNVLQSPVKQLENTKYTNMQCSLVKPPPSVQSVVRRYNEFGDKLRDIENRKSCD